PSLPVLLYGVVAGVAIDHLYIGGLVPGILMMVLVAGYGVVAGIRAKVPRPPFVPREAAKAAWAAKWDLGLPIIIGVAFLSGFAPCSVLPRPRGCCRLCPRRPAPRSPSTRCTSVSCSSRTSSSGSSSRRWA